MSSAVALMQVYFGPPSSIDTCPNGGSGSFSGSVELGGAVVLVPVGAGDVDPDVDDPDVDPLVVSPFAFALAFGSSEGGCSLPDEPDWPVPIVVVVHAAEAATHDKRSDPRTERHCMARRDLHETYLCLHSRSA